MILEATQSVDNEINPWLSAAARFDEAAARLGLDAVQIHGAHGCDRPPLVDVPTLDRSDVLALSAALTRAASTAGPVGTGWFPRTLRVNERMTLLATYPWMSRSVNR